MTDRALAKSGAEATDGSSRSRSSGTLGGRVRELPVSAIWRPGFRWAAAAACLLLSGPASAADSRFLDWIVGAGGVVVADADDRFFVRRDFLNASEQNMAWATGDSELVFEVGPNHTFAVPGADFGPTLFGARHNFAWGTLRLAVGQRLDLEDANTVPGAAQYLRRLVLAGGLPQIADLKSDGTVLYYDRSEPANGYLGGQTFALAGGGFIAPFPPQVAVVPTLDGVGLAILAATLLGLGSLASQGRLTVRSRPPGC